MRVALATEGTYPYHRGGVSQWCDLLIRGLPDIDFQVVSLTGTVMKQPAYPLPANVSKLTTLPLWRIDEPDEIKEGFTFADTLAKKLATNESEIRRSFIPHLRTLLAHSLMPLKDRSDLAEAFCALHAYFQRYDYASTWKSASTWQMAKGQLLILSLARGLPTPSLQDGTEALLALARLMSVLTLDLPEANVYHATVSAHAAIPGIVAKRELGTPLLLTEHGVYLRERALALAQLSRRPFLAAFFYGLDRALSQVSYQSADLVAPVCDYNQRWEIRNGADPVSIRTICNGISSERFVPTTTSNGRPTLAWVGRIDPLKDVKTILQAMASVHQHESEAELLLAGIVPEGGEGYYQECLALREELGLEDVVKFLGPVSDVASIYNRADVVVLSSISEAFPYTIIEAMMCGKAVVASAVGGVPQAVGDTGILVDPGDPDQLAAACLTLLRSPERRQELGRRARERAQDQFTEEKCAAQYREAYQRLWQIVWRSPGAPLPSPLFAAVGGAGGEGQQLASGGISSDSAAGGSSHPSPGGPGIDSSPGRNGNDGPLWSEALLERLRKVLPNPNDELQVAAFLESWGITDSLAQRNHGSEDVFQLASSLYARLEQEGPPVRPEGTERPDERGSFFDLVKDLLQGPLAVLPLLAWVALLTVSMDRQDANSRDFQALGLAPMFSLLVTGGFVQAMARRALSDISRGDPRGAARHLVRVGLLAIAAVVVFGGAMSAVAFAIADISARGLADAAVVYFALSLLWLGMVSVTVAGRRFSIGLSELAGMETGLIAFLLATTAGLGLESSLRLAVLMGFLVVLSLFLILARSGLRLQVVVAEANVAGYAPRARWLVLSLAPYFLYGLLFLSLNLVSSVTGWFGALPAGGDRDEAIRVLGLGMTVAIVPFLITVGISEFGLRQFFLASRRLATTLTIDSGGALAEAIQALRGRQRAFLLSALVVASGLTFWGLKWAEGSGLDWGLLDGQRGTFVVGMGLFGYMLLALGMFDCSLFVTLSRPRLALKALGAGLLTSLALAAPLSWTLGYQYAAVAFVVGTAVFLLTTALEAKRLFRRADLAYYTSF